MRTLIGLSSVGGLLLSSLLRVKIASGYYGDGKTLHVAIRLLTLLVRVERESSKIAPAKAIRLSM